MRVSDNQTVSQIAAQIQRAQRRLVQAHREASSGSRIDRPSADPVSSAAFTRIQQRLDANGGYRSAIRIVQGNVEMAESTLATAGDLMSRAREIALQGANGSMDAAGRRALAQEVKQIRDQLLALANQKGSDGYLFGGTATQSPPFDQAGTFVGNDDDRVVQIGPRDTMVVSVSGARAFTAAGGRDVFADLEALQTALSADSQGDVAATVNALDACQRQILAARIDAGVKMNRLSIADTALGEVELALSRQRHDVADADPAAAYSRLVDAQSSLEQAIAASKTLLGTIGKAWL